MTHKGPTADLSDLAAIELEPHYAEMLRHALADAGGDRVWVERKTAEARDLCALAGLAPRMTLERLSLATDLMVVVRLRMPVPCRFDGGDLVIAQEAVLGIRYRRDALLHSQPGTSFVQVLLPLGAYVPNVAKAPMQVACLGDQLPAGIRVTELVLMTYRSLALQDYTIDDRDPAGLFRPDVARYYQSNTKWLPLTDEPFVTPADQVDEADEVDQADEADRNAEEAAHG